jgi:ribosomal protein S3AE
MAAQKSTKVLVRRRKFINAEIPLIRSKIELIGNSVKDLENKTVKLDLTRQLKGKNIEAVFKIKIENEKAIAYPQEIKLMTYFIRRIIRKRISYVEDSFETPSQESMIIIKPFLITRKKVSKAVRKTLRNKCKNWIEDYIAGKKDSELFNEILSNKMQKILSLMLKKTYPLSLCEIRALKIKRSLRPEEVPKIEKLKEEEKVEAEFIDQMEEIEQEKIKKAEKEIHEIQEKASEIEKSEEKPESEKSETEKKPKKSRKKAEKSE